MSLVPLRSLLWLDGGGGLLVGVLMLALSTWLQPLFRLPEPVYFTITAANLAYGTFGLFLASRKQRSRGLVVTLAVANALWGVLCVVGVILLADRASVFGLFHIASEGAFVFWLAQAEWRNRALLSAAEPSPAR